MRFSYIDSKGKEIEVDSVESLALRIEVGAIQPETEMYDAMADRWAPAEEHPVYRSLARGEEVTEEDIVPIGADEEDTLTAAATAEPEASPEPEPTAPEPAEAEAAEPEAEPSEADVADTIAETASREEAAAPEAPAGGSGDDPLGLDFSVTQSEAAEADEEAVEIEDLAPPRSEPAVTSGPPPPPLPEEEPEPEPEPQPEPAPADDDELP
ncbi:MAG: hypothetical protein GWM92_11850, partial [Gemmatimonadetes bacterium]|nr:hypothetical protein [Gemmatimonadota bacterium]NIR77319.1 hypothetical protein [Gemmatimonadota bacterium]NIT88052.1 hypothetical protein [Gemmatimonadota bacterium]NIU31884.1 hypothetical protein [Gemmatimonadota bacterium]NIU34711.1 hypothetical protein [Gemmatimonadota bacterium]